jgi:hypothetical protein
MVYPSNIGGLFAAVILCAEFLLPSGLAQAAGIRTVALSYQPAPGATGEEKYSAFSAPVLNDSGHTAFWATLGSNYAQGIWSEGSGNLALVARTGSQAAGLPAGANYSYFVDPTAGSCGSFTSCRLLGSPLLFDDGGHTAFWATVTGTGVDYTNYSGIWSEGSGSLALVARQGSPVPGSTSGRTFGLSSGFASLRMRLNRSGRIAFSDQGMLSEGSGTLTPIGPRNWSLAGPVLNDAGRIAFSQNSPDYSNDGGVWSEGSGNLVLMIQKGSRAPGTEDGVVFGNQFRGDGSNTSFGVPALNNGGRIAFRAYLTNGTGMLRDDEGIWLESPEGIDLVAREGEQPPGTPDGVTFVGVSAPNLASSSIATAFGDPVFNNAGQVAFRAAQTGRSVGIWATDRDGELRLVARSGVQAPGMADGVRFDTSWDPHYNPSGNVFPFRDPVLNDAGQIAFWARVTCCGVSLGGSESIWATDRSGALRLIARAGEQLEVAPGQFRTISALDLVGGTGNSDGRASGFNNRGQIAFWASFNDVYGQAQGIFVSDAVAILPGDFNGDGAVDAADYVTWRKGLGTTYSDSDYNVWRANFGRSMLSTTAAATHLAAVDSPAANYAVPEPVAVVLALLLTCVFALLRPHCYG